MGGALLLVSPILSPYSTEKEEARDPSTEDSLCLRTQILLSGNLYLEHQEMTVKGDFHLSNGHIIIPNTQSENLIVIFSYQWWMRFFLARSKPYEWLQFSCGLLIVKHPCRLGVPLPVFDAHWSGIHSFLSGHGVDDARKTRRKLTKLHDRWLH